MPAVSGEIQITYGGFAVGGDTDRVLDGFTTHHVGKDAAAVEFSFFVHGDTPEDFASECKAAESAFRAPYQDLQVTFGGSPVLALRQGDSTGLDAVPDLRKDGDEGDTGRSRRYSARIEYGIPADKASMSGRRESSIEVDYSPSRRRTVTFSGTWTAVGSTDARAQYTSASTAWITAALSAIGGTYEKVEESVTPTTNDKTADFRTVYREIFRAQSGSGTDDTGLVDPTLIITRRHVGPGYTVEPATTPLVQFECQMTAGVDHDVAGNLSTKWDAIKTWLVNQVQTYLGGGSFAVTELSPDFDEHEHRLSVRLVAVGTDAGSATLVESIVTVRDSHRIGKARVPAWTGVDFSRYTYQGPAEIIRTISWGARFVGTLTLYDVVEFMRGMAQNYLSDPYTSPNSKIGGWSLEEEDPQIEPKRLGTDPWTMDVTDVQASIVYTWVAEVGGGGVATEGLETARAPGGRAGATTQ